MLLTCHKPAIHWNLSLILKWLFYCMETLDISLHSSCAPLTLSTFKSFMLIKRLLSRFIFICGDIIHGFVIISPFSLLSCNAYEWWWWVPFKKCCILFFLLHPTSPIEFSRAQINLENFMIFTNKWKLNFRLPIILIPTTTFLATNEWNWKNNFNASVGLLIDASKCTLYVHIVRHLISVKFKSEMEERIIIEWKRLS